MAGPRRSEGVDGLEELRRSFPEAVRAWERDRERSQLEASLEEARARRRREEEERRRLEALPPKVVIYTVHGTFARNADWTRRNSSMCERLRRDLGWRVKIWPVLWSGRNRVEARWCAARRLARKIECGTRAYPEAKHFVIAHSHGGNVALTALADPGLAKKVAGVITLATPFLSARVVKPEEVIDPGVGLFASLFAGWCVIFAGVYLGNGWGWWLWALAAALGVLALLLAGWWLNDRMHGFAERLADKMPPTALPETKLAVVRVEGDEAIATLAGSRFAGTCVRLFWRILTAPAFRIMGNVLRAVDYGGFHDIQEKLQRAVWKGDDRPAAVPSGGTAWDSFKPLLWQSGLPFLVQLYQDAGPTWRLAILGGVGVYGLPAAVAVLLVALSVPVGVLTSVSLLPCGWTVPFAGPYLQLAAEPSPAGRWSVSQFPGSGDGTRLDHSYAHQAPEVWSFAAEWISERL